MKTVKPKVLLSACLTVRNCRFNGGIIESPAVRLMKDFVDFTVVCPEEDAGLGTPRESMRLVKTADGHRLFGPKSGTDFTAQVNKFNRAFVGKLPQIDGALLKSTSPSCGPTRVKLYASQSKNTSVLSSKERGLFASELVSKYPALVIEDEDRLRNLKIYDHFLIRIFTHAEFRQLEKKVGALVEFQARHKYLFMAYNQAAMRRLGRLVANSEGLKPTEVFALYEEELARMFQRTMSAASAINVFEHMLGHFKDELAAREKQHFLNLCTDFRNGRSSSQPLRALIQSWLLRYDETYLEKQRFLQPYPDTLMPADRSALKEFDSL